MIFIVIRTLFIHASTSSLTIRFGSFCLCSSSTRPLPACSVEVSPLSQGRGLQTLLAQWKVSAWVYAVPGEKASGRIFLICFKSTNSARCFKVNPNFVILCIRVSMTTTTGLHLVLLSACFLQLCSEAVKCYLAS